MRLHIITSNSQPYLTYFNVFFMFTEKLKTLKLYWCSRNIFVQLKVSSDAREKFQSCVLFQMKLTYKITTSIETFQARYFLIICLLGLMQPITHQQFSIMWYSIAYFINFVCCYIVTSKYKSLIGSFCQCCTEILRNFQFSCLQKRKEPVYHRVVEWWSCCHQGVKWKVPDSEDERQSVRRQRWSFGEGAFHRHHNQQTTSRSQVRLRLHWIEDANEHTIRMQSCSVWHHNSEACEWSECSL